MKIKAFLLTIVVIFSIFTFNSCEKNKKEKDREYDESTVLTVAQELIKKSEKLNDIYYGYGIEADMADISNANGNYFPADILSCEKFGIRNVSEIKKLTRECFTEAQSNLMINTVLNSTKDTSGEIINFARYYQEYDSLNPGEEKCIMVYTKYKPFLTDKVEYLYDTLRVDGVEGQIIVVEIEVKATNPEGNVQNKKLKINLLEEKDGFRLDSPTYARYNQYQN